MNEKVTLPLIKNSICVGYIELLLTIKGDNKCCIETISDIEGCQSVYEEQDFFYALLNFRQDLEKNNFFLACYGSLDGVYPSGMTAGMTNGMVAYDFSTAEKIQKKQTVRIFDEVGQENYQFLVSISQQKRTREDYFQRKKQQWIKDNQGTTPQRTQE